VRGAFATAVEYRSPELQPGLDREDSTLIFSQEQDGLVLISTAEMSFDISSGVNGPTSSPDASIYCLLMGTMVEKDSESNKHVNYLCTLVLKPSSLFLNAYERIGVLDIKEELGLFDQAPETTFRIV
jgi:hypothetical protein